MKVMEMERYDDVNRSSVVATSSIKHTMSATDYLISAHVSAQQHYCQQSNQGQGALASEISSCSTTGFKNIHIEVL